VIAELGLNERQNQVVVFVKQYGRITNPEYQQAAATTRATAIRDLADLVAKGVFARHGAARSAYYTLARNRPRTDSIDSPHSAGGIDSKLTQLTQPTPTKSPPADVLAGKRAKNAPNAPSVQPQGKRDTKGTKEASARKPASAKNVPMVPKARKATASPQGAPKGQKGQGSPP
jgi:hypothetical protein